MNLKESFRYQNFLDRMLTAVTGFLSLSSNVTTTKETHLRKDACPDASDEEIVVAKEKDIQHDVGILMDFLVHIISERKRLSSAITFAKASCGIDIDSSVSINKTLQFVSQTLSRMASIKTTERNNAGRGYKINNEGNQTPYVYVVKTVTTIDFDRNDAKGIAKRLITEADATSANIDKVMVETNVDYTPAYDVNDTLEDVLSEFVKASKK